MVQIKTIIAAVYFFLDSTLFLEVENRHSKLEIYRKIKKAPEVIKNHVANEI